jgi:hypothetical protein
MIEFVVSLFLGMVFGMYIASQITLGIRSNIRKNKFIENLNKWDKEEKRNRRS